MERGKFTPHDALTFKAGNGLPVEPDDPREYLPEPDNGHYSNKGGHKARSDFWKSLRHIAPEDPLLGLPDKTQAWLIRRDMPRHPRNGKK